MAQYFVDCDDLENLNDFTSRNYTPNTFELTTDDSVQVIHVLNGTSATSFSPVMISWDDVGRVTDCEVALLFRCDVYDLTDTEYAVAGPVTRYDPDPSGHSLGWQFGAHASDDTFGGQVRRGASLGTSTSGTWNNPAKSGIEHASYNWVRFRAIDSGSDVNVYVKIWAESDTEPSSWDYSYTPLTAASGENGLTGYVGFGGRSNIGEYWVKKLGVGTGTDSAPTEPLGATVAPGNVSQGQAIDSPTMTQSHQLNMGDVSQAQSVDAATIQQTHQLTASDVDQGQSVDAVTMQQTHQLTASDVDQGQSIDAGEISVIGALTPSDVAQLQLVDNVTIVQTHELAPVDVSTLQTTDSVVISTTNVLSPDDVAILQSIDGVSIVQTQQLTPVDTVQLQLIGGNAVSIPINVIPHGRALVVAKRARAIHVMKRIRALTVRR